MLSILIMYCIGSQDSVVGIVTRPWAEHLRNPVSTPGRGKRSLLQNHPEVCGITQPPVQCMLGPFSAGYSLSYLIFV